MCGRTTGSSRSACRFVPEPDTNTAMRASIGRTLPRGPSAQDRGVSFDDADGRAHDERDGALRDASVATHGRHVRRLRPTALRRVRGSRTRSRAGTGMPVGGPRRRHPRDARPRVPGDGRVRPSTAWWARRSASPCSRRCSPGRGSAPVRGSPERGRSRCAGRCSRACAAVIGLGLWLVFGRRPVWRGPSRSSPGRSSLWARCSPRSTPRRSPSRRSPRGSRSPPAPARRRPRRVRKLQVSRPTCLTRPWAGALIEQVTGRSMCPGSCVLEGGQDGEVEWLRYGEASPRPARSSWSRGSCLIVDSFLSWQKVCFDTGVLGGICAKANAWGGNGGWAGAHHGDPVDRPADLGGHPIHGACR